MLFVDMADLITGYSDLENKTGVFCTMLTASEDTGTGQRGGRSWPALQFIKSFLQTLKYPFRGSVRKKEKAIPCSKAELTLPAV